MRLKAWIALILSCALAAGVLAGCGAPAQAMGRYAEEPLALPENIGQILYTAMKDNDTLVFYAYSGDNTLLRYTKLVEAETTDAPVTWLNELLGENGMVSSLSEAPNGTVYAIVSDGMGKSTLYRCADGQTAEVIEMPDWSETGGYETRRVTQGGGPQGGGPQGGVTQGGGPQGGGGPGPGGGPPAGGGQQTVSGNYSGGGPAMRIDGMPRGVIALDDGFLVSYMQGNVYQYDAAGKKVRAITEGGGMGMGFMGRGGGGMAVYENTLALADLAAREIALYDLKTGQKTDAKPYDALDGGTYVGLDKDGLLLGDNSGVYRWEKGAWKMAVDGGLTSLVMPTLSIEGLFDDGTGTYYAFLGGDRLTGGEGMRLLRFTFDESLPAQPDTTLEVFALNDSTTVRMAIGVFQRKNPNVRVRLEVGLEDSDAATTEDVVRALNTRFLANKGPDVLILDGLPIQSYIEKGVLKDITNLAQSLDGLMQNLTSAYARDGKVYGLPALFGFPAMVGDKEVLEQFTSLEALVRLAQLPTWQSREPGTPILRAPDALYDENTGMLMDYYEACVASFTNANGSLNEAALAKYLGDMLALSDALKAVTPQSTDGRRFGIMMAMSNGRQSVRMDPRAIMDVAQGNALSCVQQITGMGPLMMTFDSLGGNESMALQSLFGHKQFYPRCGAGVVAASKQQMLAEDFIALLLSSEVQDSNLFDGLPVNRASLQSTLENLKSMAKDMRGTDLNDMGFIALCDSLTAPLFTDETVKAAVAARMKSLLDGSMSPGEAAAKIVADTKKYLME